MQKPQKLITYGVQKNYIWLLCVVTIARMTRRIHIICNMRVLDATVWKGIFWFHIKIRIKARLSRCIIWLSALSNTLQSPHRAANSGLTYCLVFIPRIIYRKHIKPFRCCKISKRNHTALTITCGLRTFRCTALVAAKQQMKLYKRYQTNTIVIEMEVRAKYEKGVFKPLEKVKGIKSGEVVEISLKKRGLRNYKFFGMWKDRKDINSKDYVRRLREWKR